MGGSSGPPKVKRVMTQAINLIFEFLKNVSRYCLVALRMFKGFQLLTRLN